MPLSLKIISLVQRNLVHNLSASYTNEFSAIRPDVTGYILALPRSVFRDSYRSTTILPALIHILTKHTSNTSNRSYRAYDA